MNTLLPIRILIADDHEFFREDFKSSIQKKASNHFDIVGEAENGKELIWEVENKRPDIVITDIKMPVLDGFGATRHITQNFPQIGIIALSMLDECSAIYDMFEAGARGYLLKNSHVIEIIEAIETVCSGQIHYCSTSSSSLIKKIGTSHFNIYKQNSNISFNKVELSIIKSICKQMTTKQIADRLFMSVRSVEDYSKKIKDKTEARNIVGITLYAVKNNIVSLDEI